MKLLVLLISYCLVMSVEHSKIDSFSEYYFWLCSTCLIVIGICVAGFKITKSKMLIGYAVIQLIAMVIYWQMINPVNFTTYSYFLYDMMIPFSSVILMYELILLFFGFKDGYNACTRLYNDCCRSNTNNTSSVR